MRDIQYTINYYGPTGKKFNSVEEAKAYVKTHYNRPEEVDIEPILTKDQKRVMQIVEDLKHYINTYEAQPGYLGYTDETIILDMIYGLGIAIDPKYKMSLGFDKFKKLLKRKYLKT